MKLTSLRGSRRLRRGLTAAAALTLGSGMVILVANQAMAASGCKVTYTTNEWSGGFTANLNVTNLGDTLSSWTLEWDYANANQKITQGWNGTVTQSGQHVTIKNTAWNGTLGTNASVNPGFQGTWSGSNPTPTAFKLNGLSCGGTISSSAPASSPVSSPSASASSSPSSSPSTSVKPSTSASSGTHAAHVDNPYVSAKGYINPEWKAKADAESGGSKISSNPTGVWLDRIAAIKGTSDSSSNGSMGLRDHLDAALAQGATYAQFVIYDLPGRDCSALASNGELGAADIDRYKSEYIDPIAEIESDAKYGQIRIINIVEIDSLPNLVTNTGSRNTATANCDTMKSNGNYQTGIAYALGKLHAAGTNTYNYIDAGHHGWIGWPDNMSGSVSLFAETVKAATGGFATVDGFITNTANYSALEEPFLNEKKSDSTYKQTKWIDWNDYVDELSFAQAMRTKLVSAGFDSKIGMLIDTSRNGWGGSARPTKASTSTNAETWVNESRIDRRYQTGNWCNQSGAGIGERPTAAPKSGIDAYVWIKPPGESDGSSSLIPNDEGKGFDRMCDPTYTGNARNNNNMSGALDGAPISGAWFSAQFQELMKNAYPPLS